MSRPQDPSIHCNLLYRKHHSTETALLKILDNLYSIVNDRRSAVLVGLDLSAAFDTIEHDILIERLQTVFGVSGTALGSVETYLREREQYVMASGERSSSIRCDYGGAAGICTLSPFSLLCVCLTYRRRHHITWSTIPSVRRRHTAVHCR